ncbi:MAG: four helix bundle protein [Anaerolineae bacterium]|nr:four helix bundle protein [Anaerolineae bacterium]
MYKDSKRLAIEIHKMSLLLPKFELYEESSQVRRSAKAVTSAIVEGYSRKRYKADFVRFLVFSHSSCLETKNHLFKINRLYPGVIPNIDEFISEYDILGAKIFTFIKYVEENWR